MKQYRPHILVACVLATVMLAGMQRTLQHALTDMRFGWFPRGASGDIVLVAIDSPSIQTMGVWPWPRQHHAELIGKLSSAGANDIVFDVDFSSPSNPKGDRALTDALQKAGGSVVLPAFQQWVTGAGGKTLHVNRPLPQFDKHAWSAIVNVVVEPDGLVRHYSFGQTLDGQFVPSIGALLAGKVDSQEGSLRIDYSIRAESVPAVSYADVLRDDATALQRIKGKKVLIGASAIELGDRFNVPNGHVVSGPQLQILAAETILQDRILRPTSGFVTWLGLGGIVLLMAVLWRRRSAGLRVAILVGAAVAAELSATFLQARFAIILDTALWHFAVAAYLAAVALDEIDFLGLLGGIAEKRFQQIAMSLSDGLACTDRNGLVTVWNPTAEAIFGYSRDDMIGQPLHKACLSIDGAGTLAPFSILDLPFGLQESGGLVVELAGQRENGESFPLEASVSRWEGPDGFQFGAVLRDITVRKQEEERIRYLAEHDTLTSLANRHALYLHLNAALDAARAEHASIALLILDLDKFKQINDAFGHACGDQLLSAVARRLAALVEGEALVARLSGDEFAVVFSGADVAARAAAFSEQTCVAFKKIPFVVSGRQLRINVSIGVAIFPKFGQTADELLGNADLALYRAKAAGRGTFVFFEQELRDEIEQQAATVSALQHAVARREFELFYQPQINLKTGELAGAETLIRWNHPQRGLLSPSKFMPLANGSAISNRIALWVIETACRQGQLWQQLGYDVRLGVNLAPSQFQSGDLPATVAGALERTGFSPSLLELEVTENILLEDDEAARETFRQIQELGVRLAFDDFGTGYASLTYLKKFSIDGLKIDQSFVRELRADSDDAAIVSCTISMGKLLGLRVIAEGIESPATAALLEQMGCEEGQGYHFGRPMPAAEFERTFLQNETGRHRRLSA